MSVAIPGFMNINSVQAHPKNLNGMPKRINSKPVSIGTWNCPMAIKTSGQLMDQGIPALRLCQRGGC